MIIQVDEELTQLPETSEIVPVGVKPERSLASRVWKSTGKYIASRSWFNGLAASSIALILRFINFTNRRVAGTHPPSQIYGEHAPMIVALWHGQHLLSPFMAPKSAKLVALFSKSADAELNARIVQKLGYEVVRGSGGREGQNTIEKGGARALIVLKRAIDAGKTAVMIADISKGTPREAGLGIIMLAKLTGRPIIAAAYASSRRKVFENTWDKTTLNLPFGRAAAISSEPLFVPKDAGDNEMESLRQEITNRLNNVTTRAYQLVDKRP